MLVYIAPTYWETNGASQTNRQSVARCLTKLKQVIAPRAARRYAPPPMAVRLAADLSVRGRVRSPHISVQIA